MCVFFLVLTMYSCLWHVVRKFPNLCHFNTVTINLICVVNLFSFDMFGYAKPWAFLTTSCYTCLAHCEFKFVLHHTKYLDICVSYIILNIIL